MELRLYVPSSPSKVAHSYISLYFRPQLSIATAIVFFHRFYSRRSLKEYDRFVGATLIELG